MRAFLGLSLLILLFASAAAWQGRLTQDLRRRQDHQRGVPLQDGAPRETLSAGWNTLIVGRPSGADPFFARSEARARGRDERPGSAPDAASATAGWSGVASNGDLAGAPALPRYEPDFQITVRPGDVLSKVCQGHYRTRPQGLTLHDIVGAVARYNGLATADAIRVGDVIRLPDVGRFVETE